MKRLFATIFGAAFFTTAMMAIAAPTMPSWGPFCIGGAGALLGGWWAKSV